MAKRSSPVLIGDLLVNSELITLSQMADTVPISLKTGLPVGRILVSSGFLSEPEFKAAVAAQSLVRENLLPLDMSFQALKLVRARKCTLDEALKQLGWRSEYYEQTNRLGELLVEAGCLSGKQLEEALDTCFTSGLPLGRALVLNGSVNEMLAYAALTAQVLIREGHITRDQAIEGLRVVAKRKITIEESLYPQGFAPRRGHTIRFGELLMLAGLVSEIDLLSAVERGLVDEQPIGQVLVNVGLITGPTVEQALALQSMVTANKLLPLDAASILRKVRKSGISLEQALQQHFSAARQEGQREIMELPELLRSLGLITQSDMIKAIDYASSTGTALEEVMAQMQIIDVGTLYAANTCHALLKQGQINQEQCIFALQTFLGSREDIEQILVNVGWKPSAQRSGG